MNVSGFCQSNLTVVFPRCDSRLIEKYSEESQHVLFWKYLTESQRVEHIVVIVTKPKSLGLIRPPKEASPTVVVGSGTFYPLVTGGLSLA